LGSHDNDVPFTVAESLAGGSKKRPGSGADFGGSCFPQRPEAASWTGPRDPHGDVSIRSRRRAIRPQLVWHQGDSKPPGWLPAWGGRSCLFIGQNGMLLGNGKLLPEEKFKDFPIPPETLPRSPGHWIEWVGFHFDIGNAGRVGPAEKWINVLGRRIVKIHVKDFSAKPAEPGARSGARPKLLDGDTNWPAVMKALDGAGYSGWAISEQPSDQASNLESARDLAARMDKIFAS
jgi:hypothetical protein